MNAHAPVHCWTRVAERPSHTAQLGPSGLLPPSQSTCSRQRMQLWHCACGALAAALLWPVAPCCGLHERMAQASCVHSRGLRMWLAHLWHRGSGRFSSIHGGALLAHMQCNEYSIALGLDSTPKATLWLCFFSFHRDAFVSLLFPNNCQMWLGPPAAAWVHHASAPPKPAFRSLLRFRCACLQAC